MATGEAKVVVKEIDKSQFVQSSGEVYAGIVVYSKKGPTDKPTLVTSQSQLYARYVGGNLPAGCDDAMLCAKDILRDCSHLYVMRVVNDAYSCGAVTFDNDITEVDDFKNKVIHTKEDVESLDDTKDIVIYSNNAGDWAKDIYVDIDANMASFSKEAKLVEKESATFVLKNVSQFPEAVETNEYVKLDDGIKYQLVVIPKNAQDPFISKTPNADCTAFDDYPIRKVNATLFNTDGDAIRYDVLHETYATDENGEVLYTREDPDDESSALVPVVLERYISKNITLSELYIKKTDNGYLLYDNEDCIENDGLICLHDIDTDAEKVSVTVRQASENDAIRDGEGKDFYVRVYSGDGLLEEFVCSLDRGRKDGFGESVFIEDVLEQSNYIRASVGIPVVTPLAISVKKIKFNNAKGSGVEAVSAAEKVVALKAFEDVKNYPVTVFCDGGDATKTFHKNLITLVEKVGALAVLVTPEAKERNQDAVGAVVDYRNSVGSSSHATMLSGHIKEYDSDLGANVTVAASGLWVSRLAWTQKNYELWYPVGGTNRGLLTPALDVIRNYTEAEGDVLVDNQIVPIHNREGYGVVIWGNETLQQKTSMLSYTHVRLLVNMIKRDLKDALQDYLFELISEELWANIKTTIDAYMDNIKARGGVDSYLTVCDKTNNSAQNIDEGDVNVEVIIVPPGYAKRITLTVVIKNHTAGITEEEE